VVDIFCHVIECFVYCMIVELCVFCLSRIKILKMDLILFYHKVWYFDYFHKLHIILSVIIFLNYKSG
jgi:hypothetical protein